MNNIILLSVAKLKAHPQNPRKDLGDLEELTESIKAKGILQPLTVVEDGSGSYKVIIGHRRLGAAIKAKLKEVPCVIRALTEEEQLQIMLMENMQREDLNAFEQAQGFQLMIDAGISTKTIAEQTGFTQKTVKQRAEWAKLDQTKLEKLSVNNQLTIAQLCEITEVSDLEVRNKVLDTVGTKNFNYELQKAKDAQRFAELKKDWLKNLKTFAEKVDEIDFTTMTEVATLATYLLKPFVMPEDANEIRYFYKEYETYICLYKQDLNKFKKEEKEPSENENKIKAIKSKVEQIKTRLEHQGVQFEEIRRKFIKNYKVEDSEEVLKILVPYLVDLKETREDASEVDAVIPGYFEAWEKDDEQSWGFVANRRSFLASVGKREPVKTILLFIYAVIEDDTGLPYRNKWENGHNVAYWNDGYAGVYSFLESLGYKMSDAEAGIVVGSDPVFKELEDLEKEYQSLKNKK